MRVRTSAPIHPVVKSMLPAFQNQVAGRFNLLERHDYRKGMQQRILAEEAIATVHRSSNSNGWTCASGDYRNYDRKTRTTPGLDTPLAGNTEGLWKQQIDDSLARNKGTRPTIFLEFGAGHATSLMRAGREYAAAVAGGDLILAATNLGYMPSTEEKDGYSGVARSIADDIARSSNSDLKPEYVDFAQANQHRIQFMDTSILELPGAAVETVNGNTLPLLGNTSIIFENDALMHAAVPEVALGMFAAFLTVGGTLNVTAKKRNYMHTDYLELELANGLQLYGNDPDYNTWRGQGLEIGHAAIQTTFGMHQVSDDMSGPMVYIKER